MIGYWNDDEDAALQGLSLEAQVIYLRGIRRFSDKNGIAGIERRINRASLSEVCHFLPERRSPRGEVRLSWDQVRRRLDELERSGLIIRRDSLVFELPLSVRPKSVQMKMTCRRHVDDTPLMTRTEDMQDKGFNGVDDTKTTPPNMALDDTTPPVTDHHLKDPTTLRAENPHLYQPDNFPMFLGWKPSPEHISAMPSFGVKPALMTSESMADFYSYWIGEGCTAKQGQWEHRLNNHLKTHKPKTITPGAANENRSPAPRKLTPVQRVRIANGMHPDTGEFLDDWQPGSVVHVN